MMRVSIIIIGFFLFSCNQEKNQNLKIIELDNYGMFYVPDYISESKVDTIQSKEIDIEFIDNSKGLTSFNIIIYPFTNQNNLGISGFHELLESRFNSESPNTVSKQLVKENNLGISLYTVNNKNGTKSFLYFKHYIDYSDSVEVRLYFRSQSQNDSIYKKMLEDAELTINSVDYERLSKMKFDLK